ncbi:SLC13 family permease [Acetonema longum]|uniref:Na+/H+ antiporter NhaD-like permease n=1 Tax=Acetonema longum DSM 6540 TaxID=1009370 RepID=F7NNM8_9FIRM|nr:SLC13 family permease [Acetonema longum]EGO62348.1 Na+/H+ antiporter NhaD-like permease [Acetonema longum DSM 6540]
MSLALMSLIALLIVILISCVLPYNVGLLAIAFSFIVGILVAGMKVSAVLAGFPVGLFIILLGVTYLFGIAQENGTLDRLCGTCIKLVNGKASLVPIAFFLLGFVLSAIGPGPIPVVALLAPPAMGIASKLKINPFLMAILVINGANAASMSPITPSGAIAVGLIAKLGMPDISFELFRNSAVANAAINVVAYILFGGLTLLKNDFFSKNNAAKADGNPEAEALKALTYQKQHFLTLIGIGLMLFGALVLKFDVGLTGIFIGTILILLGCADEKKVLQNCIPWGALLMVCGVSVLVGLMSQTGGMDMFIGMIASISTPHSLPFVATLIPGLISAYSSSVGVVLPAFLPMVPGLVEQVGGDLVSIFSGVCMGSFIVDASPLSTLGALIIGAATPEMDKRKLFNQLLAWGLTMAFVGAAAAWLLF